ncbi:hypothetical protein ACFC6L_30085 [Kitasatospora phosalacinea]|uniref:hypothetical protein n=1 Tax=Kitasatospora phosalacinea TaxID=2065 RepID=UPI0035E369E2
MRVEPFVPDVLVNGPTALAEFGVDARIVPTPGHTAGAVSVLTDDGDPVAGDLIADSFTGPLPGRPANPPFHDDRRANLAGLRAMPALRPTRLHVGHGTSLTPDGPTAGPPPSSAAPTGRRPAAACAPAPRTGPRPTRAGRASQ